MNSKEKIKKTKIVISSNEAYPVYDFRVGNKKGFGDALIEIDESLLRRMKKVVIEYDWLQEKLAKLSRPQRLKEHLKRFSHYRCKNCGHKIEVTKSVERMHLVNNICCSECKKSVWELALDFNQ